MFDKLVRKREVHTLLYPYAEFPGELSVTYSQIIKDPTVKNGEKFLFILRNLRIMALRKPDIRCQISKKFIIMTLHRQKQKRY